MLNVKGKLWLAFGNHICKKVIFILQSHSIGIVLFLLESWDTGKGEAAIRNLTLSA